MRRLGALICILCAFFTVGCDLSVGGDTDTDPTDAPPLAPALNNPAYGSDEVSLTWTCGDATVDGFVIGRSDGAWDDGYATVADGSVRAWTDTGTFTPGTTYSYRAKSTKGAASSDLSNTVSITIPLPEYTITYKVSGTATAGSLTISYSDSAAIFTNVTPSALPWEQSVTGSASGYGYGLQVSCTVTDISVTLNGEIWMDGVRVQEQSASSTSIGMGIYWPPSINLSYMTP